MEDSRPVAVLGGGIAGLSLAWELSRLGTRAIVLEARDELGGLARTIRRGEYRYDLSAHRFAPEDQEVRDRVLELMGDEMLERVQRSRILLFDRLLRYPFSIGELMRAMPLSTAARSLRDYFWELAVAGRWRDTEVLEGWALRRFGRTLYSIICEPYVRKLWKMEPSEISSDWASERLGNFSLSDVIRAFVGRFAPGQVQRMPDSGPFHYPVEGFGSICSRMAEEVERGGGEVLTGCRVTAVDLSDSPSVSFLCGDEKRVIHPESVASTIPPGVLLRLLEPKPPQSVFDAAASLKFVAVVFVNMTLARESISNDTWLYFPGTEVPFTRLVEFRNWSPKMAPEGSTSVCADITCRVGDSLWNRSDAEWVDEVADALEKLGLARRSEVGDAFVLREANCYPIYDLKYAERLAQIRGHLASLPGLQLLGRTGAFHYHNSDVSIEMGFATAREIVNSLRDRSRSRPVSVPDGSRRAASS